ncbi:hypothetical protein GX51_08214 [Blastomyces parvus]|uniref:Uncharacterized protein n=1 Tax=Blastomyces parvus TaxID=2060905 RepID=A0A2B7WG62_9EURO|nr:hypothetical protein GX51_08214 [Blastomyces parvus]
MVQLDSVGGSVVDSRDPAPSIKGGNFLRLLRHERAVFEHSSKPSNPTLNFHIRKSSHFVTPSLSITMSIPTITNSADIRDAQTRPNTPTHGMVDTGNKGPVLISSRNDKKVSEEVGLLFSNSIWLVEAYYDQSRNFSPIG